jgi:hypothetical protein
MPDVLPVGKGGARLLLDDAETHLLRQLTAELRALLDGGGIDHGDPVYERLFPAVYEGLKDEAAYRDLVGDDLLTHKLAALDAVSSELGADLTDVTLEGDALDTWLSCLTDLRLAIGTRLDVDEDRMSRGIDASDPDAQALAVMHWLGWIQEGVLQACDRL